MGDSSIIILNSDSTPVTLDSLPDDVRIIIEQAMKENSQEPTHDSPLGAASVLLIASIFAFILIRYVWNQPDERVEIKNNITPGCYDYNGAGLNFSNAVVNGILEKRFAYYRHLSPENKIIFTDKLQSFMHTKTFRLPADETFKEVPVLISAAATQLTFGLDDCNLQWFKLINVFSKPYLANDPHALRVLAGHVEGDTINIAWSNFLSGISNAEDGVNVGLHELAHALYYQHIIVDDCTNKTFATHFNLMMHEIEQVYQKGFAAQQIFSAYAYKNQQEFWAESAEIFFERSAELQQHFPFLYNSLCRLLNQDPMEMKV